MVRTWQHCRRLRQLKSQAGGGKVLQGSLQLSRLHPWKNEAQPNQHSCLYKVLVFARGFPACDVNILRIQNSKGSDENLICPNPDRWQQWYTKFHQTQTDRHAFAF